VLSGARFAIVMMMFTFLGVQLGSMVMRAAMVATVRIIMQDAQDDEVTN
jgi:hypothetical protein